MDRSLFHALLHGVAKSRPSPKALGFRLEESGSHMTSPEGQKPVLDLCIWVNFAFRQVLGEQIHVSSCRSVFLL